MVARSWGAACFAYERAGAIILNPDEEVQARLHLVFAKLRELQSARGVMRFLRASGLPLPVRPLLGPSPHEVVGGNRFALASRWRQHMEVIRSGVEHGQTEVSAERP